MRRRDLLLGLAAPAFAQNSLGFSLTDTTAASGIRFRHNNGAFGAKHLPETLGSGCAFLDYDADGWLDILLINGMDWPGHRRTRSTLALYKNNRNGTFTNVTHAAGLDIELYGMGVAVGDYDNDGFPDLYITCVGQNRLFHNNGKGRFIDVTTKSGLGNRQALSTSAMWLDYDRDGLLDLFVCNYVQWNPTADVFCSLDGKNKAYCTPEAYRGATCWLFRNKGDGTFSDATAVSGIFDSSSKSLGVAMLDIDGNGWPDIVVANDTRPNRLYKNKKDGTFEEVGLTAGIAFREDGKARAGMGVDIGDFEATGKPGIAITNFDNEMLGLYRATNAAQFQDVAATAGIAGPTRNTLGFGCLFADINLDGALDLLVANGHIDDTVRNIRANVGYQQAPHLFLNDGKGRFQDVAAQAGADFAKPKLGRGLATGDFDNDGDLDVLITTNGGDARLYKCDVKNGNQSIRFHLRGTKSNRDAIGATVKIFHGGLQQTRLIHSGSSYLSQSALDATFGVGRMDRIERAVIQWPNGLVEEHKNLATGATYDCVEGQGMKRR